MSPRDLISGSCAALWAHKLRTGLTMFGIAWGILSVTIMVAAGEGLRAGQRQVAEALGKDIIILWAGRTSMQVGGIRAGKRLRWRDTDYKRIEAEAVSCRWVLPEYGRSAFVRSAYNSASLRITSSLPPFADIRSVEAREGRFYSWDDVARSRRVAFIGSDVSKQLFGARPALGETIHIGPFPYTVIGVMRHKEQDSSYDGRDITKVFVPVTALVRDLPQPPPSTPHDIDQLLVQPRSVAHHQACKWEVKRALGRIYNFDPHDKEAVPEWDTLEEAAAFGALTDGMKLFLGSVGVVTLLLGGLGVMNVMLVTVKERTREIGIRKAAGATSRSILMQFFLEAVMIVAVSGAAGLAIAHGICALVNTLPMPMYFAGLLPTRDSSLLAFALLAAVAVFSAIYPATRAASVDPIEALRYEAGG